MTPDAPPPKRRKRRAHTDSPDAAGARARRLRASLYILLLMVLVFSGAMFYRARHRRADPNEPIIVAEHFIGNRFGSDAVLRFSPPEWTKMEQSGDTVTVAGSLESISKSQGQATSYTYNCVLSKAGGSWTLVSLDLMKQ